jgi:hypothetical protein
VRLFFAVIKMLREGFGTGSSLGFCCRCASRHGLVPKGNRFGSVSAQRKYINPRFAVAPIRISLINYLYPQGAMAQSVLPWY